VIFAALVVATFYRSWWFAVDHPLDGGGRPLPRVAITLAPALLLTALLAQSVVESRMLVEGGWLLLILIAVKTKLDLGQVAQDLGTEPPRRPERAAAGSGRR
jgi:hypothetical protein